MLKVVSAMRIPLTMVIIAIAMLARRGKVIDLAYAVDGARSRQRAPIG